MYLEPLKSKLKGLRIKLMKITSNKSLFLDQTDLFCTATTLFNNICQSQVLYYRYTNLPYSFVDNNTDCVRCNVEDTPSFSMIYLMWHTLLDSTMTLQKTIHKLIDWKIVIVICHQSFKEIASHFYLYYDVTSAIFDYFLVILTVKQQHE